MFFDTGNDHKKPETPTDTTAFSEAVRQYGKAIEDGTIKPVTIEEQQEAARLGYKRDNNHKNQEHRTKYQKEYRDAHPEETKEQNRKDVYAWRERNPDQWKKDHSAQEKRRKARKKKARRNSGDNEKPE